LAVWFHFFKIFLVLLLFVIGSSFISVDKCGIRWTLSSSYQTLADEWDFATVNSP
jgi:hypothetical protein